MYNKLFETIDDVKRMSIKFMMNYPVHYVKGGFTFRRSLKGARNKSFCTNNGIIAFIDGDTMYVIPEFDAAVDIIMDYCHDEDDIYYENLNASFHVPLSNGEILEDSILQHHWETLKMMAEDELL